MPWLLDDLAVKYGTCDIITCMESKLCKRCNMVKPLAEFKFRADRNCYEYWCRLCNLAYWRERARKVYANTELTCPNCKETKPVSEFPGTRKGQWCKECKKHYARDYYRARRAENPTYGREAQRKSVLKRYGLSLEDFNRMLEEQDGKCAICSKPPGTTDGVDRNRLVIDHSHATGKARALLCDFCNRGLGIFFDDPALLVAAADYLRRFEEVR